MSSILLSALLGQSYPTLIPQVVTDPIRIAQTPSLDGKIDPEEWEPFTKDGGTYFQWEPAKVFWAAQARQGNDVVFSYDGNGDGWLVGKDNIEVRASLKDGNVVTAVRRLDATDPNGAKWVDADLSPDALTVSAHMTNDVWQVEGELDLGGIDRRPEQGAKAGVRIDTVPAGTDLGPAFVPRAVSFVRYSFDSGQGLFPGLTWTPKILTRLFSKDDTLTVKYDFHVAPDCPLLKSVAVKGDGRDSDTFTPYESAFPALNRNRDAQVVYKSPLSKLRGFGWKVLKMTVTSFNGTPCTLRTSFRLADTVDMDASVPDLVSAAADAKIIRADVNVWSASPNPVEGVFRFTVPKEWTITRGQNQNFRIVRPRGRAKLTIEFIVPKGTKGTFPLEFISQLGGRSVRHVQSVRVQ